MTTALTRSINGSVITDPAAKQVLQAALADLQGLRAVQATVLRASATIDVTSLADGAGATSTVTVPGAALGDLVLVSHGLDLQGISVSAWVSAVDVVSIRFQNESAGTLDLASTTARVMVIPLMAAMRGILSPNCLYGAATLDLGSLVDAAGQTATVTVTGAALGDLALVSHGIDTSGILVSGYVSAADTVSARFQNETAGTLDIASAQLRAVVIPSGSLTSAFGGQLLTNSVTYDAASLSDAAGTTKTVSVPGAALGDFAMASLSVDLAGITMTAYVSAADTVAVRLQNESGGTLDLASATLRVAVLPKGVTSMAAPLSLAA